MTDIEEQSPVPESPTPQQQREDFTSEAFKIEIRNIANYGFGVSGVINRGRMKAHAKQFS